MKKVLLIFSFLLFSVYGIAAENYIFVKNISILNDLKITCTAKDPSLKIEITPSIIKPEDTGAIKITSSKPNAKFSINLKAPTLNQTMDLETRSDYFGNYGLIYLDDYADHVQGDIKENKVYHEIYIKV